MRAEKQGVLMLLKRLTHPIKDGKVIVPLEIRSNHLFKKLKLIPNIWNIFFPWGGLFPNGTRERLYLDY